MEYSRLYLFPVAIFQRLCMFYTFKLDFIKKYIDLTNYEVNSNERRDFGILKFK